MYFHRNLGFQGLERLGFTLDELYGMIESICFLVFSHQRGCFGGTLSSVVFKGGTDRLQACCF